MAFGPLRLLGDIWFTLAALVAMVRDFIVRWFLPLHIEEDAEPRLSAWDDDGGPPAAEPAPDPLKSDEAPVEPVIEPPSDDPVIAPPVGASDRVSRGPGARTWEEPWGDLDEEPEEEKPAPPPDDPENPFVRDNPGASS